MSCNTIFGNAAEFSTKTINQLKKDGCSEALNHARKVFKKTFFCAWQWDQKAVMCARSTKH